MARTDLNSGGFFQSSGRQQEGQDAEARKWDGRYWTLWDTIPSDTTKRASSASISGIARQQHRRHHPAHLTPSTRTPRSGRFQAKAWSRRWCRYGSREWRHTRFTGGERAEHQTEIVVTFIIESVPHSSRGDVALSRSASYASGKLAREAVRVVGDGVTGHDEGNSPATFMRFSICWWLMRLTPPPGHWVRL